MPSREGLESFFWFSTFALCRETESRERGDERRERETPDKGETNKDGERAGGDEEAT